MIQNKNKQAKKHNNFFQKLGKREGELKGLLDVQSGNFYVIRI